MRRLLPLLLLLFPFLVPASGQDGFVLEPRVIPIERGGTGASDAETARDNLGLGPADSPSLTGLLLADGTSGSPALRWTAEPGLGLYRHSSSTIGVSGALVSTNFVRGTVLVTSGTGSSSSPAIRYTADPDTGIFFPSADTIGFATGGTERARIDSSGQLLLGGQTTGTALLDVNSDVIRLRNTKTPASASAAGNAGDICWDSSAIYLCPSSNSWVRVPVCPLDAVGTNTAGSPLVLAGPKGTGNAAGGSVKIQVAPAGSSGSSQNSLMDLVEFASSKLITIADAASIAVGTTTGLKIGTSTSQKLGFFDASPVAKPAPLTAASTTTIIDEFTAIQVLENVRVRLDELESRLQSLGLLG